MAPQEESPTPREPAPNQNEDGTAAMVQSKPDESGNLGLSESNSPLNLEPNRAQPTSGDQNPSRVSSLEPDRTQNLPVVERSATREANDAPQIDYQYRLNPSIPTLPTHRAAPANGGPQWLAPRMDQSSEHSLLAPGRITTRNTLGELHSSGIIKPQSDSINMPTLRSQSEFYMAGVTTIDTRATRSHEKGKCSVCIEPLEHDVIKILACGHEFHTVCVQSWFDKSAPRTGTKPGTCPNCRRELYEPDLAYTQNGPPFRSDHFLYGQPALPDPPRDGWPLYPGPLSSPSTTHSVSYQPAQLFRRLRDPGYVFPHPTIVPTSSTADLNEIVPDTTVVTTATGGRRPSRQLAEPPPSSRAALAAQAIAERQPFSTLGLLSSTPSLPSSPPQDAIPYHPESPIFRPRLSPEDNLSRLHLLTESTESLLVNLGWILEELGTRNGVVNNEQIGSRLASLLTSREQQRAFLATVQQRFQPRSATIPESDHAPVFQTRRSRSEGRAPVTQSRSLQSEGMRAISQIPDFLIPIYLLHI
ncbi:hypothetical protein P3342_006972 [Pyrenophora teres f. teres]|nr:hypothetical protein P3342_006972 [Pyrenophora teres f. teres]